MRIPIKATAREPIKQAGYISATSVTHARSLLRNAAGPYIGQSQTDGSRGDAGMNLAMLPKNAEGDGFAELMLVYRSLLTVADRGSRFRAGFGR